MNTPAWIDSRRGRRAETRGAGSAPRRRPRDGGRGAGPAPRTRRRSARRPAPRCPGSRAARGPRRRGARRSRPSGTVAPTPARSSWRLTPMPKAGVTSRRTNTIRLDRRTSRLKLAPPKKLSLLVEARARGVGRVAGPRLEQERAARRHQARPLQRREVRQVRAALLVRAHPLHRVFERGRGPAAERALEAGRAPEALAVDEDRRVERGAVIASRRGGTSGGGRSCAARGPPRPTACPPAAARRPARGALRTSRSSRSRARRSRASRSWATAGSGRPGRPRRSGG